METGNWGSPHFPFLGSPPSSSPNKLNFIVKIQPTKMMTRKMEIFRLNLITGARSMGLNGSCRRIAEPPKWIKYGVSDKRERRNKAKCEFFRIRSWMVARALSGNVLPDLTKPPLVVFLFDNTQSSLALGWMSILSGLTENEDVLYVVLDDRVRFIGFA